MVDAWYITAPPGHTSTSDAAELRDGTGHAYIRDRIAKAKALTARSSSSQEFSIRGGHDQDRVRSARFVHFKPWDWIITAEADQAEFTEASDRIATMNKNSSLILIAVSLKTLLLTGVVWQVIAASITKPILQVIAALEEVAQGNLTRRLSQMGSAELGTLARAFNLFLDKLQEIIRELSHKASGMQAAAATLTQLSGNMSDGAAATSQAAGNVSVAALPDERQSGCHCRNHGTVKCQFQPDGFPAPRRCRPPFTRSPTMRNKPMP